MSRQSLENKEMTLWDDLDSCFGKEKCKGRKSKSKSNTLALIFKKSRKRLSDSISHKNQHLKSFIALLPKSERGECRNLRYWIYLKGEFCWGLKLYGRKFQSCWQEYLQLYQPGILTGVRNLCGTHCLWYHKGPQRLEWESCRIKSFKISFDLSE